ncbi:hypothetical protein Nepgr_027552 [Nepenthes gracilis]|uniref:Glycosyltransferase family 92 protein n=1 Tax=Nepenthes gracilis TaxID=150966 RepID=A0AAD3Y381_NEPGR|nr:hypothetical protein Nepgr_027552 [Nepenthes gracilis]
MKDRSKRELLTWSRFFWSTLFVAVFCILFSSISYSSFHLLRGQGRTKPELLSTWRNPLMEAVTEESQLTPSVTILQTVMIPDQSFLFLNHLPSSILYTKDSIDCVYLSPNSSEPVLMLNPLYIDGGNGSGHQAIVRCPLQPRGVIVTLRLKASGGRLLRPGPTYRWDSLAYEAVIDYDNSTIVFFKGFGLKPNKLSDPTRFECVYGWEFRMRKLLLRSEVLSIGQEIARCKTPLSVLNSNGRVSSQRPADSIRVSVKLKGRDALPSAALPIARPEFGQANGEEKLHEMCVCTMLRNQARFLQEWIMYHAKIGVQRWFLYDNNSDDDIKRVIKMLNYLNYNVTRHLWPWIKSQEAGFAHCALRARGHCKWVGFIDVDEFFHSPLDLSLGDVVRGQSKVGNVGEVRIFCYNFGPSGLKKVPRKGVTVGYTCRTRAHERHKSIVRPEALNPSLLNEVHHFHLREGFDFVTLDRPIMGINHYKYQVWEVFKEKFYRRVATYVSDWQDEQNVGSKDRAPGLGTRAIEPSDWSSRFCKVNDTELRDRVVETFEDPETQTLPWEREGGREAGEEE